MSKSLIAIIIALLSLLSCAKLHAKHTFGIHIIRNGELAHYPREPYDFDPAKYNLDSAMLDEPLITDKDIVEYDWKNHVIKIDTAALERIPSVKAAINGIPFVVVADGKRCYVGAYWTHYSSLREPRIPIIDITRGNASDKWFPSGRSPDNGVLCISFQYQNMKDSRNNPKIYKCLRALGKLRE
jgi:hypothetical protein